MATQVETSHERQTGRVRSIVDYVMGSLLLLVGAYLLLFGVAGWRLFNFEPSTRTYLLGSLFVIYGAIRFVRAVRRNKY